MDKELDRIDFFWGDSKGRGKKREVWYEMERKKKPENVWQVEKCYAQGL